MNFDFYDSLNKPHYAPDKALFRPVWSTLYFLMAISFLIFYFQPMSIAKFVAIPIFFLQLILNLIWTPIFFKFKKIGWAFLDSILLFITVVIMTNLFFNISVILGFLQIPYLLWLMIALRLNYDIYRLNIK